MFQPVVVYISLVLTLIVGAVAVTALVQAGRLRQRLAAALGQPGPDGQDPIETTLANQLARVEAVDQRLSELNHQYTALSTAASLASQKISIVRFNPFGDTGGDQSFSLAVLDAHNSGYVISSIHGRQGTRVYAKPIDFSKSKYALSADEQQALSQAIKRVPIINPKETT